MNFARKFAEVIVRILPSGQYLGVFITSRAVDFFFLLGIPLLFGVEYVVLGWAIGLAADCIVEFVGHRKITFHNSVTVHWWTPYLQFVMYGSGRYVFAGISAGLAYFLADGVVGGLMLSLYVASSVAVWLVQVQFIRLVFRFRTYYRLLRPRFVRWLKSTSWYTVR